VTALCRFGETTRVLIRNLGGAVRERTARVRQLSSHARALRLCGVLATRQQPHRVHTSPGFCAMTRRIGAAALQAEPLFEKPQSPTPWPRQSVHRRPDAGWFTASSRHANCVESAHGQQTDFDEGSNRNAPQGLCGRVIRGRGPRKLHRWPTTPYYRPRAVPAHDRPLRKRGTSRVLTPSQAIDTFDRMLAKALSNISRSPCPPDFRLRRAAKCRGIRARGDSCCSIVSQRVGAETEPS
jgi:hypothetical protein